MKQRAIQIFLTLSFLAIQPALAQTVIHTTPNPKTNPAVNGSSVVRLKVKDIWAFLPVTSTGIIATVEPGSDPLEANGVVLEIYAYDSLSSDGKGALVYGCFTDVSTTDFGGQSWDDTWEYSEFSYSSSLVSSTDIKRRSLEFLLHNPVRALPPFSNFSTLEIPVIVEARITHSVLHRLNVPGLGNMAPEALFKIPAAINFSGLTDPNPVIRNIINTYEDLGGIQIAHYGWAPYNDKDHIDNLDPGPVPEERYMEGQGITIARLDMSDPAKYKDLYELKFTYLFKDRNGNDIIPERCTYDDKPLGGQMDVLSHAVAREGAVFGINGTFYDYYYRCIPGVRQLIKIDGQTFAYPNVLSHKLQGAVGIDFEQVPPVKFQKIDVLTPSADGSNLANLGDISEPNVFRELSGYRNVMSGGHFSSFEDVYQFSVPSECMDGNVHPWPNIYDANKYPWQDEVPGWETLKWQANDQLKLGWAYLACQRSDFDGGYGNAYKTYFTCDKLDKTTPHYIEYRKLLTCADSRRTWDEFGGSGRQIRKARTFLAWKNNSLYMVAVDGLRLYRNATTNAVEEYNATPNQQRDDSQWGFTLDELGRFYSQMKFDYLLHLDGGTSTEFFVNGRGMLQRPIESFATLDGPLRQRYTSSFVLVVPKFHPEQIGGIRQNRQFLELNNSDVADMNNSILEMTPSLAKVKNESNNTGLFSTAFSIQNKDAKGAVLFSMSEDSEGRCGALFIAGTGRIPATLLDSLRQYTLPGNDEAYHRSLNENNQASYAIIINKGIVQQAWFDEIPDCSFYNDSRWHRFTIFQHPASGEKGLFIDGREIAGLNAPGSYSDFFNLENATHMMMGAVKFGMKYHNGSASLRVDNTAFVLGDKLDDNVIGAVVDAVGNQIPVTGDLWNNPQDAYLLQMEELKGLHAFATDGKGNNKFFGLLLNGSFSQEEVLADVKKQKGN